ncbi:hypothetical protein MSG28_012546 [Choristoneura fumiferana]|uniref:Uncharacterized protein n=1 Tax=Choristoneura fumiferana TaxID=7141 RepID=A0ACC0JH30_CHOFU|nr:hypothetical protein MSG28_012546 [Choristoneura fumiferana]
MTLLTAVPYSLLARRNQTKQLLPLNKTLNYWQEPEYFHLTFWLGGHILFKLAKAWWKEPDTGVPAGARDSCSAARMWRAACSVLVCPDADEAWTRISDVAPPDTVWHSLRNCAGVWQNLLSGGVDDAMQPAAFKLAIVLRHTPTDLVVRLLAELLRLHPQSVS